MKHFFWSGGWEGSLGKTVTREVEKKGSDDAKKFIMMVQEPYSRDIF